MRQFASASARDRAIAPKEASELRKLLNQLICAAAIEVAAGQLTGAGFERFKQIDDTVSAIIDRINQILG